MSVYIQQPVFTATQYSNLLNESTIFYQPPVERPCVQVLVHVRNFIYRKLFEFELQGHLQDIYDFDRYYQVVLQKDHIILFSPTKLEAF